jgi:hypothetical protein
VPSLPLTAGPTCRRQLAPARPFSPSRCPLGPSYRRQLPSRAPSSLSVPWASRVSAERPFARRSLCSVCPACRKRPPNRPRSPPWMRPSLFWSPPTLTRPPPLSYAPSRAPSPSLSLSRSVRASWSSPWSTACSMAAVEFLPRPLPRWAPPLRQHCGTSSGLPQPLWFARSALTSFLTLQPEPHHRRPKISLRPCRCSGALESPLEVINPSCPYFPVCCSVVRVIARWSKSAPSLGSSTAIYALWCPRAVVMPMVESIVSPWVHLSLSPSTLDLRRGRALASSETSLRRRAPPLRLDQPPCSHLPLDLGHSSEIGRPKFN